MTQSATTMFKLSLKNVCLKFERYKNNHCKMQWQRIAKPVGQETLLSNDLKLCHTSSGTLGSVSKNKLQVTAAQNNLFPQAFLLSGKQVSWTVAAEPWHWRHIYKILVHADNHSVTRSTFYLCCSLGKKKMRLRKNKHLILFQVCLLSTEIRLT